MNKSAAQILNELGLSAKKAALKALAESAEIVADEARRRCPVYEGNDKRVVKGALRDSIYVGSQRANEVQIIADARAKDGLFYGRIVEYSPKGRPFMYPALDAKKDFVRKNIVDAVRRAIRK